MLKKTHLIEILIVLLLVSLVYIPSIGSVEFHIDESYWIGDSDMFEAFFKGEFFSEVWDYSHATTTSQPVPRYLIGIGRYMGGFNQTELNTPWNFNQNKNFNIRNGAMPSDSLLWWSRLPMAIMAILSIFIGYVFARKIAGPFAGFAWVLLNFSPYMLLHTRRAMAESSLLFFTLLAILFCWLALNQIQKEKTLFGKKSLMLLSFSAVCIALAGESKMNGLTLLFAVSLVVSGQLFLIRKSLSQWLIQTVLITLLLCVLTVLVFWFVYPFLWVDLIGRTIFLFTFRLESMAEQVIRHAPDHIATFAQRIDIIPQRIFQDYAAISLDGFFWLNLGLSLLGLIMVFKHTLAWWRGQHNNASGIIMLLASIVCSVPAFFTLLDWDRYYIYPIFFSSFYISIALGDGINRLKNRLLSSKKTAFEVHSL